jgi:hypothetical protein
MSILDDYQIHLKQIFKGFESNIHNPYINKKKFQRKFTEMNNLLIEKSSINTVKDIAVSRGGFVTQVYRKQFYLKRAKRVVSSYKPQLDKKTTGIIYQDVKRSIINRYSFLKDAEK